RPCGLGAGRPTSSLPHSYAPLPYVTNDNARWQAGQLKPRAPRSGRGGRRRSAIPGMIRVGAEPRILEAPRRFAPRERISAPTVRGEHPEADQSVVILVTDLEQGRGRALGVERDLAHGVDRLFADPGRLHVIRRRPPGP